jgi:uncharacterized protein YggE
MRKAALVCALLGAYPASAQVPAPSQILVSASGTVRTPPDMATIGFTLRGEGATSDEAAVRLRDGAASVRAGVAGLMGTGADYQSSGLSIVQVRSRECDANMYGQQRLSTGPCAVVGYVATMSVSIDTPKVTDAGTLAGLIGRLGGVDVGIRRFWLRDEMLARRRAMQLALTNGHDQAQIIAGGGGVRLGPLLRVQDADYNEMSWDQSRGTAPPIIAPPAPAPPPPPPPVRIDLAPEPIQTTVRVMVAYGIVN